MARINPYVEKYMEETGCNIEEAANELGLNWDEVYDYDENDDNF